MRVRLIALSAVVASCLSAEENSIKLQEVTVTSATGFEQNIADAPASISVITAEELQKKSYKDVTDAVKNVPGVFVSGGGDKQDITIRGMGSQYTLYLVDGRPVSAGRIVNTNGSDGGKIGGFLPSIDMIERIEVIRGPMSSLYGSDAMGGVINIITKKNSMNEWRGSISTEYTKSNNKLSNDNYATSIFMSGPIIDDKLSLGINGTFQGTDESDFQVSDGGTGTGYASEAEKKIKKLGGSLNWRLNDSNDIGFNFDYTKQKFEHNAGKSSDVDSYNENEKKTYSITHKANFDNWIINSYIQKDDTKKIYRDFSDSTKKEDTVTLNSQATYFTDNNALSFGAQYRHEKVTDNTNGLLSITGVDSISRWLAAVFVEDEFSVTDDFIITAGLRYNHDEYFKGHLTPRLYGIYHLNENLTFKGGVSTGYKQPTLTQMTDGFGQNTGRGTGVIIGNPDLKPEKSVSYEAGFNYSDRDLGIFSSLMLFRTDFKDKIQETSLCESPGTNNNSPVSQWQCNYKGIPKRFIRTQTNVDEAVIQGLEISFDYDITSKLRLNSNYTYTHSKQKTGDFVGEPLNKIPKHAFNVNLDYEFTKKWSAWTQYNYRGKTSDYLSRTSMSSGSPAYGFLDLGVVYKPKKELQLGLGVYNLTNKDVSDSDYNIVLEGRRFTASVSVKF